MGTILLKFIILYYISFNIKIYNLYYIYIYIYICIYARIYSLIYKQLLMSYRKKHALCLTYTKLKFSSIIHYLNRKTSLLHMQKTNRESLEPNNKATFVNCRLLSTIIFSFVFCLILFSIDVIVYVSL